MGTIEDRAATTAAINTEGERVYALHQTFAEMGDDTPDAELDAAWDRLRQGVVRVCRQVFPSQQVRGAGLLDAHAQRDRRGDP